MLKGGNKRRLVGSFYTIILGHILFFIHFLVVNVRIQPEHKESVWHYSPLFSPLLGYLIKDINQLLMETLIFIWFATSETEKYYLPLYHQPQQWITILLWEAVAFWCPSKTEHDWKLSETGSRSLYRLSEQQKEKRLCIMATEYTLLTCQDSDSDIGMIPFWTSTSH